LSSYLKKGAVPQGAAPFLFFSLGHPFLSSKSHPSNILEVAWSKIPAIFYFLEAKNLSSL
jgi:hypothetical protein